MAAPLKISTIFSAMDKFSAPLRAMANSSSSFADRIEATTARAERGFRRLSGGLISETGKQFLQFASTAAVAAGIVSGVMFSVNSLKEYETAIQSFRTIVSDATDEEFAAYREQISAVAKDTKKSSIEVAQSFEKIAGLNADFAKTADGLGQVSAAAITLAKASGMASGDAAENLVGIMNQFGFAANEANKTINVLAAGQAVGAANIGQTAEAFKNFGATAKASNITIEESVGLIQTLGQKSILGAEAGTKLRGAVSKLQEAGVGYASGVFNINDALTEARAKLDKLKTAKEKDAAISKMFGLENKTAGLILLDNIQTYKDFTAGVTGTSEAAKAAAINSSTLAVKIDEAKASWVNLITSSDQASSGLNIVKNVIGFVTDNMATLATIAVTLTGAILAYKAVILISTIVTGAYNIAIGVYNALFTASLVLTNQNVIAQKAFAVTSKIGVAAFWLYDAAMVAFNIVTALATGNMAAFNAIMSANPIGLIIGAVVILIALIAAIVIKWDEWGAALSIFLGPLGLVISMIQSFRRNWDLIRDAFAKGDIGDAFKLIGFTILDAVIQPIQQLLELIGKLPGSLGEAARAGAQSMEKFRSGLGVSTKTNDDLRAGAARAIEMYQNSPSIDDQLAKAAINPTAAREDNMISRMETTQKQNVSIMVEDKTGRANVSSDNDIIPISLKPSFQF